MSLNAVMVALKAVIPGGDMLLLNREVGQENNVWRCGRMHYKLLAAIACVGIVLAAIVIFRIPTEIVARMEPVTDQLPPPGAGFIVVKNDIRVFTLFAAMNAAGYDDENNDAMHPVRVTLRNALIP
jgi:hypothetical protein